MKAEILKIAGVKSEKEFYKKFPTEEAFQKAHGKEFRKAKLGSAIPKAQPGIKKGSMEDIASKKQKCGLNDNDKQAGKEARALAKEPDAVIIPEWNEISNIENLGLDKKGRKALEKEYEAAKANYPGLDLATYVAATRDAGRTNIQFNNPERAKYFDPKTGALLPNVDRKNVDPYLRFYRGQFPTQSRIAPTDVLNTFSNMPGGLSNYSKYANVGYVPPMQRQGGQTKKLKQLTSYEGDVDGIMPIAKGGKKVPKLQNANTQGLGLNSPAGVQMNVPASMAIRDPFTYQLNGTPGPISGGSTANQFAGINTAGTYQMDARQTGTLEEQIAGSAGAKNPNSLLGKLGGVAGIAQTAGDLIGGFQQLKEQKKLRKQTEQGKRVSELTLQAASTRPEQQRRRYNRPEDALIQPEQLSPSYGVGTNYLAKHGATLRAEDGMQIGGNLGEIQNTYAPNNLYDDLGYEPLSESEMVKQYYAGGYVPKAKFGMSDFMDAGGAGLVDQGIDAAFGGGSGGGRIGGALGKTAGKLIGGPVGGMIGGAIGKVAGNLLDTNAKKIKANQEAMQKNLQTAAMQSGAQALQQGQYSAYVRDGGNIPQQEEGGWVSHDWQPQVISQFNGIPIKSLLTKDPMMDTLRTGGRITQNNIYPQDQYALGGSLKTTWGGHAETMSHNPYLPGTGETVMFRGKSHEESDGNGHTGIGVKYGDGHHDSYTDYAEYGTEQADADVEVERGEPATEMVDPETGEKNMVVFGNLKIPNMFLDQIGDPKAKGKKFKNYVAGLSKQEARQNKIIDKASNKVNELEPITSFDKLTLASLDAMQMGAHMNLQDIAQKKTKASIVQNAINETAEENMLDADALAKGKFKIDKEAMKQTARFGKEIFKAQTGTTTTPTMTDEQAYDKIMDLFQKAKDENIKNPGKKNSYAGELQKIYHQYFPDVAKKIILGSKDVTAKAKSKGIKTVKDLGRYSDAEILDTNIDDYFGDRTEQYVAALQRPRKLGNKIDIPAQEEVTTTAQPYPITPLKKTPWWMTAGNTLIDMFDRPLQDTDVNLYPEMMALSMNTLEPVPAQTFQPQLLTPYDVSYQDQLNEVTAQARDAMRMAGGDPSALAAISSQANLAKSKVLGEQFRQNQAQRMGVYNQNIDTINAAKLKNLDILDRQMERQEKAKSITKATALEAMKSMADKIDKNKLENRSLAVLENMYPNYRLNRNMRLTPRGLTYFEIPQVYTGGVPSMATPPYVAAGRQGNYTGPVTPAFPQGGLSTSEEQDLFKKLGKDILIQKKGGKTPKKDSRNSMIVKAIKNL
jgi:hypothetical protein